MARNTVSLLYARNSGGIPVGVIDRNRANSIDREHDETDYLQEKLGIAGTISERIFYIVKIALYLLFALEPQ
jgi:hypothetical protein